MRRRLALVVAGAALVAGAGVLPAAHASEPKTTSVVPTVTVPARQWGCVWLDLVNRSICFGM